MFLKIFQVSTEMGKYSKLVEFFNSKPFSNSCLRDLAREKQNILTSQPCLHALMQTRPSANQSAPNSLVIL